MSGCVPAVMHARLCMQEVAVALEAHEALVVDTFGQAAVLDVAAGLQVRFWGESKF